MKGDKLTAPEDTNAWAMPLSLQAALPRRITSASLLQGQRQIVIEHVGREYRLRLTASGKLILTA